MLDAPFSVINSSVSRASIGDRYLGFEGYCSSRGESVLRRLRGSHARDSCRDCRLSGHGELAGRTQCRACARLGQRAQIIPQPFGISIHKKALHLPVSALPDWHGARQQASPVSRQPHQTAAPVQPIRRNFDQAAPL